MLDTVIILTTVPSAEFATELGRQLVSRNLAACVNVLPPMTSIYRWKGEIQQDTEWQVVIKTLHSRVDAVHVTISELHPYDLPEFLVVPVEGGDPAYLAWVAACSGGDG